MSVDLLPMSQVAKTRILPKFENRRWKKSTMLNTLLEDPAQGGGENASLQARFKFSIREGWIRLARIHSNSSFSKDTSSIANCSANEALELWFSKRPLVLQINEFSNSYK